MNQDPVRSLFPLLPPSPTPPHSTPPSLKPLTNPQGDNDTIQSFCQLNYGVTFPILSKLDVNGPTASPLFEYLKAAAPGLFGMKRVKWNFEKFLVGRDGEVKERWASTTKPEALEGKILEELKKGGSEVKKSEL